jgi:hypothetical protein
MTMWWFKKEAVDGRDRQENGLLSGLLTETEAFVE